MTQMKMWIIYVNIFYKNKIVNRKRKSETVFSSLISNNNNNINNEELGRHAKNIFHTKKEDTNNSPHPSEHNSVTSKSTDVPMTLNKFPNNNTNTNLNINSNTANMNGTGKPLSFFDVNLFIR